MMSPQKGYGKNEQVDTTYLPDMNRERKIEEMTRQLAGILVFKMFDLNNKGKISKENLWYILSKLEQYKHITKDYCGLLISEVDRDNNGEIEYLEFIEMFFKRT